MRKNFLVAALAGLVLVGCSTGPVEEAGQTVFPAPPERARYIYEKTIYGSNAVKVLTSEEKFKVFATLTADGGKKFSKPFGIVAYKGKVFVSDTALNEVHVLDFNKMKYDEYGEDVGLGKPMGLAVDDAGLLYVVDSTVKRVVVFNQDGKAIRQFGNEDLFNRPTGIAVTRDGNRVFVVDTGGVSSMEHQVTVFNAKGEHIKTIGQRGGGDAEFNLPKLATIDDQDNLYVMDTGNFRVQVFSPEGEFVQAFGSAGRQAGQFSHPKGIAVDAMGRIFVSDSGFANFQIFNPEGQMLMHIGERNSELRPGNFMLPAGISVDVDGRIYIADQFHRKIDVFRPAYLPEDAPIGQPFAEPADWDAVSTLPIPEPDPDAVVPGEIDPTVTFYPKKSVDKDEAEGNVPDGSEAEDDVAAETATELPEGPESE